MLGDIGPKLRSMLVRMTIGPTNFGGSPTGTGTTIQSNTGNLQLLNSDGSGIALYKNAVQTSIEGVGGTLTIAPGATLIMSFWTINGGTGNLSCTGNFQVIVNDVGITRAATKAMRVTDASTGYGSLASGVTDAGTTTTPVGLTVGHNTSGTAAAGFGSAMTFLAQSSTTADRNVGKILAPWSVATDASRAGGLSLYACDSTGTDRLGVQVLSDGSQAMLGFYGATPVAKAAVTGSRGANAALASLLTALANLGLITDSSS
jgi:hypothetical protein